MGAGGVPDGPGGFELAVVTFRRAESCSRSLARGARSTRSATPGGVEWRIGRFGGRALARATLSENGRRLAVQERPRSRFENLRVPAQFSGFVQAITRVSEIGRASCRERV